MRRNWSSRRPGGLVLYAFVPPAIMAKISLDVQETLSFLMGLRYAYLTGAMSTAAAAALSFVRVGESTEKDKARNLASPK